MKTVFTTGEAAEICSVSQQTIIRCFDSGRLKGFKIPGSRFRRIPRESLVSFMKSNGIPMDKLEMGKQRVLVVGHDLQGLADAIKREEHLDARHAAGGFEAGLQIQEFSPDVVVLGKLESEAEAQAICRAIRQMPGMEQTEVLVAGKRSSAQIGQLLAAGANEAIKPDAPVGQVIQRIWNGVEV
jgi:excisionase family DNA binding protein